MATDMALDLIAEVMGWDENLSSPATSEYAWLRMMSSIKYDGYSDFRAGVRFIESLAVWLKQFEPSEREGAYQFFKTRLVYISPAELQCLIEIFMSEVVTPYLRAEVAHDLGIKPYEVWQTPEAARLFSHKLRRTLFVGMSDGSRIDILRRANAGKMSTEQVLPTLNIDDEKWLDLGKKLAESEGEGAKFESVYLIEDFTASGTTFLRRRDGKWKGKLEKFDRRVREARTSINVPLVENYSLHIHHYVSTDQARRKLDELLEKAKGSWKNPTFDRNVIVTEGTLLPPSLQLQLPRDEAILALCAKYQDAALDERLKEHLAESGIDSVRYGYANCALPLILDHNTPNNSIALLWAETPGTPGHSMQPLFRRRDRHG
ncbi:hypothetical protein GCM10007989_20950 [Devosia pacifica]|uniref:PRTase-CE domain-containing protein n=1 Tax=Devosia pacifica TaxID=1335967 RepID=A0A918S585_9HYPH|nr:hypothetical protein [Devosia pacifica]GHA25085.1 hypothetical protein GCM10007989_20950 [Devosia pacifica]